MWISFQKKVQKSGKGPMINGESIRHSQAEEGKYQTSTLASRITELGHPDADDVGTD